MDTSLEETMHASNFVRLENVDQTLSLEAEKHLQSLGFVTNNGKARFKLYDHDPMSANIIPTHFDIIDTDDTASFVVLGKDSLDSIQAASLASYIDIQQKGISIDCNSTMTSMNLTDMHHRLHELLQENKKLKEALKQNNLAMKQQFNTLSIWQEEIINIHQTHKKKVAETRELINHLTQENTELKMKLSAENNDNTELGFKIINAIDVERNREDKDVMELEKRISSLSNELDSFKYKYTKMTTDFEKLLSISNLTSSQLKQATSTIQEQRLNIKKLELLASAMQSNETSYCSAPTDNDVTLNPIETKQCTPCAECIIKDKEIECLKTSITALEQKLLNDSTESTQLKGCSNKEISFSNRETTSIAFPTENSIYEKYSWSDLSEVKTTEENSKPKTVEQNLTCKNDDTAVASSKEKAEDKESLEHERQVLIQEREQLEKEKQLINNQKEKLEVEYKNLEAEKKLVQQEKDCLQEEKASLDQQSQLYENHEKMLQAEKKDVEMKHSQLVAEINILHDCLQRKECSINELQEQLRHHEESISLLQTQVKVYEEDFRHERCIKESLLVEKCKVGIDLQKQLEFANLLQNEIDRLKDGQNNGERNNLIPPLMTTLLCPKCSSEFRNMQDLENHVQICVNFD